MSEKSKAYWDSLVAITKDNTKPASHRDRARGRLDELNNQYMTYLKKNDPKKFKAKVAEQKKYRETQKAKKNKK